ncbi:hypothetical protein EVAR_49260_1 [Eumeta japonica]|uniref:Uncharacterized protein n=1 Tax=Eumeta variegata TaxID=151549 RepID=A0A4C1YKD1_EUMVA|nr:hypothetical protein EVAR_49260_1 [Eumeta japonica]
MLTDAEKQIKLNIYRASLEMLQQDPDSFLAQSTTMVETIGRRRLLRARRAQSPEQYNLYVLRLDIVRERFRSG